MSLNILPSSSSVPATSPYLKMIIPDERAIVNLMEQLFLRSGLTQTALAERMGVKKQTLNAYLRYKRRNPSVLWLARFANACGANLMVEMRHE